MVVARKRFGQHFLEPAWVVKLMRAIAPRSDETFIEIGPGRGALTRPLAAVAQRVIGFEIDRDLVQLLRSARMPNVTIVEVHNSAVWTAQPEAALLRPPPSGRFLSTTTQERQVRPEALAGCALLAANAARGIVEVVTWDGHAVPRVARSGSLAALFWP